MKKVHPWCKFLLFRFRRGFKERVPGVRLLSYIYIYTYLHNDKCAHISANSCVTIIYLPLISDFISIMQIPLHSSDLQRWLNHNSKCHIFCLSRLLNLTASLRTCTLTFFTQFIGKIDIISLSNIVHSK